ncbi:MAG: Ig-like domain-containing protein [Crocosphaera sp.]|nr:Ig-like domain-containing protein [Crocosphaera sp.]
MEFLGTNQNPLEAAGILIPETTDNPLKLSDNNSQQFNSFENEQVEEIADLLAASSQEMTIPVVEEITVMGDITGDGGVDLDDARQLLRSYRPGIVELDDPRDINGDGRLSLKDVRDLGLQVRRNTDKNAPELLASLVNDTGSLNNDQLTSDASISGTLTDESLMTRFLAGFNDTPVDDYINILGILNEDGTFSLDETQLEEINNNNPLLEGENTLHLFTKDQWNNITTLDLDFILDSNAPNIGVSLLNDRGISDSDNITNDPTLTGNITDFSEIETLELINDLSSSSIDITNLIEADGSFTISESILEQINNNSPLLDEVNSFSFIGTDSAGNVSDRIVFDFTLDTNSSFPTITTDFSQPITETTLLTGSIVEDLSGLDSLTYSFSNIEKIDIIVDEFGNFSQAFDLIGVENGIYDLIIESSDIAGNGLGLITAIVTVGDIIPPELSIGLTNDTGISDTDNITNNPTLTGTITDFSEIETLELINNLSPSSVDITNLIEADGSFTINESILEQINNNSLLLNGNYSVSLVGTDTAGNVSVPLEFNFALDRQDPSLSIFLISFPGDGADLLGGSVQDNQLGDTGVASLTLQIDEGEITDIPFSEGEQINVNLNDFNLTSGEHLFTVTATDIAGNNTTFSESLLIDNVSAELTIGLTNDTGRSDNDNISNVLRITGTLIDDNTINTFEAGLNNGGTLDVLDTLQPDGTFIFDEAKLQEIATASGIDLIPGEYTLNVIFNDGDFVFATLLFSFTFDPIPAFPTVTTDFSQPITETTLLTGSIVEDLSGLDTLTYRFDDGEEIDIIIDQFGNFSQPFDLTGIANGIYELRIDSIDIAGNSVSLAIENITVGDINIPELTIRLVEDTGISDSDSITQNLSFVGTVTDESEITILDVTLNNSSTGVRNTLSILDQVQPDGSFTIDEAILQEINQGQPLTDGNYLLSIEVSDSAGNAGTLLNPFLFLDTENPSLTINTPMDNGVINEGDRLTGNTDGTGSEIATISYQFNDGVEIPITVDNEGNFAQELDLIGLGVGEQLLTVTTVDIAGNETITNLTLNIPTCKLSVAEQKTSLLSNGDR